STEPSSESSTSSSTQPSSESSTSNTLEGLLNNSGSSHSSSSARSDDANHNKQKFLPQTDEVLNDRLIFLGIVILSIVTYVTLKKSMGKSPFNR
ncbi:hypothetical protein EY680_01890, partial [Enterococcus casseliflavus]|nr:hypothetical protein [Enterococcus casseliflavus]